MTGDIWARIDILKSLVRLGAVPDVICHKKILDPKAVVIVSGFPVHMGSGEGLGFIWPFFSAYGNTLAASMWNSKLLQEQLEALGLPVVHIDILNVAMLYCLYPGPNNFGTCLPRTCWSSYSPLISTATRGLRLFKHLPGYPHEGAGRPTPASEQSLLI